MTTRDIRAHLREMYDVEVSPDLISGVTDAVADELAEWQSRPLDRVYPVIFIDALMVKIRDGVVANRPVYLAIGVDCEGAKQVLGLWIGPTTGESVKFWLSVLSELKSRGVADACIVCCDGLTGLPDAIGAVWPQAVVQLCVVHLIRASLRYASKKYWVPLSRDLRLIFTAADQAAAATALEAFAATWGDRYPAIIRLWRAHWEQFIPFLAFPPEVRRVIYTTNLIESMNARLRKVTRNRGQLRRKVLVRADSGGGTHGFLEWLTAPSRRLHYSVGMTITEDMQDAILQVPAGSWTPAYDGDGQVRDGAWVADITGMLDLSCWPAGMRVIIRKERPHPGAQLRFTDIDGHRFTAFAADARKGQLADLELRHRRRARREDRNAKDTGLRNLPLQGFAQNQPWCEITALACELLAWTQMLALAGTARRWEPKRLRLRLFSVAGRLVRGSRRLRPRLAERWPSAGQITCAVTRLQALPCG
jgi:Transposase, Mutator family